MLPEYCSLLTKLRADAVRGVSDVLVASCAVAIVLWRLVTFSCYSLNFAHVDLVANGNHVHGNASSLGALSFWDGVATVYIAVAVGNENADIVHAAAVTAIASEHVVAHARNGLLGVGAAAILSESHGVDDGHFGAVLVEIELLGDGGAVREDADADATKTHVQVVDESFGEEQGAVVLRLRAARQIQHQNHVFLPAAF